MEVKEIQKKDVEVVKDIICDCCGQSCKTSVDYEYMTLEARWGYGTKKDMEKWTAHICEKCVDEKFNFVNFKKEDLQFQTVISTDSEQERQITEHLIRYENSAQTEPRFLLDQADNGEWLIKRLEYNGTTVSIGSNRYTAGYDKQKVVNLIDRLNKAHRPNIKQGEKSEVFVCWNDHDKGQKCDYIQEI